MSDWIITPEARLVYPSLASPRTMAPKPGERVKPPQYQVTLVIPAAATQTPEFQALQVGAMNAFIAKNGQPAWQQAVSSQFHPKAIQWPFSRLGDPGVDLEQKYAAAGFQPGDVILRAKNELKPDVCKVRAGMKPMVVQPTEARGGYWVKVAVSFWGYGTGDKGNAPGVSINLGPVMITREDALITMGGASAGDAGAIFGAETGADAFAGTTSFAPPPSTQAPAPYAPPPNLGGVYTAPQPATPAAPTGFTFGAPAGGAPMPSFPH